MRLAASKIVTRDVLREKLAELKRQGRSVVFANGCFDLLHVGHVRYLDGAKQEADRLVVAINDDDSVSNNRPAAEFANSVSPFSSTTIMAWAQRSKAVPSITPSA